MARTIILLARRTGTGAARRIEVLHAAPPAHASPQLASPAQPDQYAAWTMADLRKVLLP